MYSFVPAQYYTHFRTYTDREALTIIVDTSSVCLRKYMLWTNTTATLAQSQWLRALCDSSIVAQTLVWTNAVVNTFW